MACVSAVPRAPRRGNRDFDVSTTQLPTASLLSLASPPSALSRFLSFSLSLSLLFPPTYPRNSYPLTRKLSGIIVSILSCLRALFLHFRRASSASILLRADLRGVSKLLMGQKVARIPARTNFAGLQNPSPNQRRSMTDARSIEAFPKRAVSLC